MGHLLGGGSFIKTTEDCGATWIDKLSQIKPALKSINILDNYGAWAVGNSGLIMSYRNVVGIKDRSYETAQEFHLLQNYPNPFNPETRIDFELPEAGLTRLIIYDLLGREVMRLIDGELSAGNHTVSWNASHMSSGVYLYKLTSGSFTKTNKMLLLK